MAKYEDKFIVINKKRLEELRESPSGDNAVAELLYHLDTFTRRCEVSGIKIDQKYLVCNQDEPYAEDVFNMIIGEPTSIDKEVKELKAKVLLKHDLIENHFEPATRELKEKLKVAKEALEEVRHIVADVSMTVHEEIALICNTIDKTLSAIKGED